MTDEAGRVDSSAGRPGDHPPRPPHPLGPRVVRAVPGLPDAARGARRPAARFDGGRRPAGLHPRRPGRDDRRLPRGPARGSRPDRATDRRRTAGDRAVADPHGRVPRVRRDARPQPRDRLARRRSVRRGDAGRLPPGHVRPRRPDAPDPAPGRDPPRRRVAGRSGRDRPPRVHVAVAGRIQRSGRVPGRRLRQRRLPPRDPRPAGRQGRAGTSRRAGRSTATARSSRCTARTMRSPPRGWPRSSPTPTPGATTSRSGSRRSARTSGRSMPRSTDPAAPDPATAPVWTGELRSAARANMLMNVTSARIDIKVAAGRAERVLERYAEPLSALHGVAWPERLLELAWRRVVDNSAHDSICGCSHGRRREPGPEPVRRGRADRPGRPRDRNPAARGRGAARQRGRREPVASRPDGPRRGRPRRAGRLGRSRAGIARRATGPDPARRAAGDGAPPPDA